MKSLYRFVSYCYILKMKPKQTNRFDSIDQFNRVNKFKSLSLTQLVGISYFIYRSRCSNLKYSIYSSLKVKFLSTKKMNKLNRIELKKYHPIIILHFLTTKGPNKNK
jgi:hypothetical protein